MSLRNKSRPQLQLHILVAIPVALIMISAFAVSAAAVVENVHFINATNQILDLVGQVRNLAVNQKGFAANPGENIWVDLAAAGQVAANTTPLNPWDEQIRATTTPQGMRIEDDLPARDCRRMALYFLGKQPVELGLLSIEAQSFSETAWQPVYPAPALTPHKAELACGNGQYARLALVFKVR